ncbi:MAG: hypothetical protein OQK05_15230 [Pseudopelagicola sp.]|nr:hypothetical protein [Pseudopelagicola sp.]
MDHITLWQFLEKREEEIVKMRQDLTVELKALRAARASLEKDDRKSRETVPSEKMTIKEMIRSVLSLHPEGGTSDQIIHWISEHHDVEVARTSLSPQLSRLKSDHEVVLSEDYGIWKLQENALMRERLQRTRMRNQNMERMVNETFIEKGGKYRRLLE